MKELIVVGVDVSKSTLDFFFKPAQLAMRVNNNRSGFNQWLKQLRQVWAPDSAVLVIMEHTGQYSLRLESFLRSKSIDYCKIAALQIKRSLGIIRGKSDRIDAERIADYGWLRRDILTADQYPGEEIMTLRKLLSLRLKMVRDRSGYISRLKEMKAAGSCTASDYVGQVQRKAIDFLSRHIAVLDEKIRCLIAANSALQKTHNLLVTIKGVGWVIAAYMICCTENFSRFSNARKFNCYAGIAPFKNESGSSQKGKSKVSHLANKQIKTLLDRGASSAIQHDPEMKTYYNRRLAEGKSKRSTLNIIRAKLIARMFAVIKRQTPYQQLAPAA
jgi:transposase